MAYVKPDVNRVFAATGSRIQPSLVKVDLGWVSEIPDFEFENWIQNRQDQFIAHINQLGVVAWDSTTEYLINKSYVQVTNGDIYRALRTNINKSPTISNSLDWKLAFDSSGTSYNKSEADTLFARRGNNLSDLSSAGAARSNLSVYSKSESDGSYIALAQNLLDLPNKSVSRTNLSVYSQAEVDLKDSVFSRKDANLSDLVSAGAARASLSVYSATESDGRYLNGASNLSDLSSDATARTNLDVYSKAEVYTRGESDSFYLNESNNLSDLPSDATARTNLDVYSKGESNSLYLNESNNLDDLDNYSTARSNLDVYSQSESDDRYLNESTNLGDLDNYVEARSNLDVYSKAEVYTKSDVTSFLANKAFVNGQTFTGNISAPNLSGTNTGDQTLREIGVGQTWQDLTASRSAGVVYTNNTVRPISIFTKGTDDVGGRLEVDGILFDWDSVGSGDESGTAIVPSGSTYKYVSAFSKALELR